MSFANLHKVIIRWLSDHKTVLSNNHLDNQQYNGFSCVLPNHIKLEVRVLSSSRLLIPNQDADHNGFWSMTWNEFLISWIPSVRLSIYEPNQIHTVVGIAFCVWVYHGIGIDFVFSDNSCIVKMSFWVDWITHASADFINNLIITRDWSFLLLPVWIFLPTSQQFSVRYCSIAVCQSSCDCVIINSPFFRNSKIWLSHSHTILSSWCVIIHIDSSIVAWARLACTSNGMSCWSQT